MANRSYRGPSGLHAALIGGHTTAFKQVRSFTQTLAPRNQPTRGKGYLSGEFPDGITTLEGVPVAAEVRVLWRDPNASYMDGSVVARVTSTADGTWRATGLNTALKYDVVGRIAGSNDTIMANVSPIPSDVVTAIGSFASNPSNNGVSGEVALIGGYPPYTASVVSALPSGLTPSISGRKLTIAGTSTSAGTWNAVVRVTASNGPTVDVPVNVVIT